MSSNSPRGGKTILSNFLWRFAERAGAQAVKLLVEIVLARILMPDDYGTIALVTVFITIFQVFVDSGMANALIQKKDADDLDFSSVFWFNLGWCIVLYFILFFISPLIASFYHNDLLIPVVRVLGIQIIISGIKNVQTAYVSKTMQFKRFFYATLIGTIGAAFLGIWMAYQGYGVWALVGQHLFNTLIDTIILWLMVDWRPHFVFSLSRLKVLFSFGSKLLFSAILDTLTNELRQLVIGKKYTSSDLAYYNRGNQLPYIFVSNVNSAIDSVLFPTLANEQDNILRVRDMTRRAIITSTYIMAPLMMGLAAVGESLITILLTEKWLMCVPFMQVSCITYTFYSIHTANLNAIKALGKSNIFFKLEIYKKIISIVVLLITMNISVYAIAYSSLVVNVVFMIINSWPNRTLLNYSIKQQIKDIVPSIALSAFMGICVYFISFTNMPTLITLFLQIVVGVIVYLVGSLVFKIEAFEYVLKVVFRK